MRTSNLIIIIIIYDEQISFSTHLIKTNNCVDYSYRGDEWSLRAFASMPSTAIFLRARAEIKKIALRAASSLESTTREQRALLRFLYFPLAAIHMEILFFKIKQKIF